MTMTPDEFITNVEEWDLDPPHEDYSTEEYAEKFAAEHCDSDIRVAARLAVQRLFSGTVESVTDGLFSVRPEAFPVTEVESWLRSGFEIKSASRVIEILVAKFDVHPDDALALLFRLIEVETNEIVQNQLAYACWFIVNGRTFLVQEDILVGFLFSPVDTEIEQLLKLQTLTDYARQTLVECKSKGDAGEC